MDQFKIIHLDDSFAVCLKPARVLSTDEPGGIPELVRQALGDEDACVRTVHRLDRVVAGLMVLARTPQAASELSRQIRDGEFGKEYLAVLHGHPAENTGTLTDLLLRNKPERKTYVVTEPGKGVQEAILDYEILDKTDAFSKVRIILRTGRTHQIRAQFSSRDLPLVGDRKYSLNEDCCEIALWSSKLTFRHPVTGDPLEFTAPPPEEYPWTCFQAPAKADYDFYQNRSCPWFPCHAGADPNTFSCLFCYCPLYALGEACGGNFTYTDRGIKDCSKCLIPHRRENYERVCAKLQGIIRLAQKPPKKEIPQ